MKAAVIHEYSDAFDNLKYEDVETPKIKSNELLIKIHASGVNHCDTDLRRGLFGVESNMPHVMGVDAAGEVVEVGADINNFKIGDRVACAGAEYAWHADKISIPKNLVAKIPDGVDLKDASFSTISSIALNGFRCANPELGHAVVVIGLGLIPIPFHSE